MRVRPVRKRISPGFGPLCEFLEIIDLKGEVGQIRSDQDWAAGVIFADLNFLLAS